MPAAVTPSSAASHPLLALLPADVLAAVVRSSEQIAYRAKRSILKEGEAANHVFCLLDGAVRVFFRNGDGSEVTVKLFRGPALFGEMEVLARRPFIEHVTTLERSTILRIPADTFRKLVATQNAFTIALVHDLSQRLCIAGDNERRLAFADVDARLATLLLDHVALIGEAEPIVLKVTGQGLSQDLGVSRKSMVRSLRKLTDAGVITKRGQSYQVNDLAELRLRGHGTAGVVYKLAQPSS